MPRRVSVNFFGKKILARKTAIRYNITKSRRRIFLKIIESVEVFWKALSSFTR